MTRYVGWDDWDIFDYGPLMRSIEVDDVELMHPVGFVWFDKPRYRVKAVGIRYKDKGTSE